MPKLDGKNMINVYKLDQMKKYLHSTVDEQVQYTGCKIQKHLLFCAITGGGKSNALLNYLFLTSQGKGTFDHIFICYETDETLYEYLKDNIDDDTITFIKGIENMPDVRKFKDNIHNEVEKNYLLVFDDCVNEINRMQKKKIDDYFKVGRKKGFTLAFLSQRYYDTSKFVRAQCSYIFLAGISSRDIAPILKEASIDMPKEELIKIFKYATKKDPDNDLPMLKITKIECPIEEKFARNFTDYINPDMFAK
jgi:hypothetical protein